ncbi:hypothetical protein SAMN00120144_4216 [Hymenobacter roseosalivarius DSM 11622]|uniref:Lipocalin-like domain-containing protein n=1 Tax=Hymenobacter roseosalivarius DSM 11622 TaxID=645990 RepID=A0A1W1UFC7_9BACT|nr:hypothetical protein [Hymenobacter roseosalivarius]SMB79770.1 hypothetical protein SAMN00120144_4216 [Hymenobacter roseosalivarius DSM 11622]
MNKLIVSMALVGSLAGCGQKEKDPGPALPAPVPVPAASIVGTWTGTSTRTQVDYAGSTPDTDVTTQTPAGFKLTFGPAGKLTSEMPPNILSPSGIQIGTYQFTNNVLITTYASGSLTHAVEALTSRRLVFKNVESDASSTITKTYTFSR